MKRSNAKTDRFAKERERGGFNISTTKTRALPAWMLDSKLLPKDPPHRMKPKQPKQQPKGGADV